MKKIIISLTLIVALFSAVNGQEISPYLFGQNMWLTNGAEGRPGYIDELWPKVEKSGVKIIRIGGNGYNKKMPSYETLTKWVTDIKAIGAEPLMQVSQHDSPEASAKLVAFFTKDEKTKVRFWAIGNEPYEIGKMSVDSISSYLKKHASAMKAIDPSIKIFAPDLASYYNEAYEALLLDNKNSIAGRDANGNWYIDGVSFHTYPNAKSYTRFDVVFSSVTKVRGMILALTEDLEAANKKYDRTGEDALVWGLTEFNITYSNPDDLSVTGIAVPSFITGQFWAEVFALSMEFKAFTVTPWCIQESDRPSTYFGYIGGPPKFTPHATYYHMQMMAEHMKGNYIKMNTNNAFVKVFGSKTADETTIIIMNQHENKSFSIDLSKINQGQADQNILNIFATQDLKITYKGTVEANATRLIKFNKKGQKTLELVYDLELAKKDLAPKKIN